MFAKILEKLVSTEPEPTYRVLARWVARYPHHAEALATFFEMNAIPTPSPSIVSRAMTFLRGPKSSTQVEP